MIRALIWNCVDVKKNCNGIWKLFYRNVLLGYYNKNDIREKKLNKVYR